MVAHNPQHRINSICPFRAFRSLQRCTVVLPVNLEDAIAGIVRTLFYWAFPGCYAVFGDYLAICIGTIWAWLVFLPAIPIWYYIASVRIEQSPSAATFTDAHYLTDEEFKEAIVDMKKAKETKPQFF